MIPSGRSVQRSPSPRRTNRDGGGASVPSEKTFHVVVEPGPLGVQVMKDPQTGQCIVCRAGEKNPARLKVGDLLLSVGPPREGSGYEIRLSPDNAVDVWVGILQSTASATRGLKVKRVSRPLHSPSGVATKVSRPLRSPRAVVSGSESPSTNATKGPKKRHAVSDSHQSPRTRPKSSKKRKYPPSPNSPEPDFASLEPGQVCPKTKKYYCTKNNETLLEVSEKLGVKGGWQELADQMSNITRYGVLKSTSKFRPYTLLRIPADKISPWKVAKLLEKDKETEILSEISFCTKCNKPEKPSDPYDSPMLLCDGCNAPVHLKCCPGLTKVPKSEFFCDECMDILRARKQHYSDGTLSFRPKLPPLPSLQVDESLVQRAHSLLQKRLSGQQEKAMKDCVERQTRHANEILPNQIANAEWEIKEHEELRQEAVSKRDETRNPLLKRYGISSYRISGGRVHSFVLENGQAFYRYRDCDSPDWKSGEENVLEINRQSNPYEQAIESSEEAIKDSKSVLESLQRERSQLNFQHKMEQELLKTEAAALRNRPPHLMGFCRLEDETEVRALNMLLEPDRLIYVSPFDDDDVEAVKVNRDYAIFAARELFDPDRDDSMPIEFYGIRGAQRRLMKILTHDSRNKSMVVSQPITPRSVKLRGSGIDVSDSKCFDLSELVRDCVCDLTLPKEATPPELVARGLELREYQQMSLKWMLDKEIEPTGMGTAGELWSRLQFLDGSGSYFYSEVTGSYSKDIFDFKRDTGQNDVSENFGSMPVGGILDEMGLGKTACCIALIVSNPPPKYNRVLPREHSLLNVSHSEYCQPPTPGLRKWLSNGTVVVAPMTLCSQWKDEIRRWAPWLSVLTLHSGEDETIEQIASTDVVVVSTFVLNGRASRPLLNKLKRIHFHRGLLDEAMLNQSAENGVTKLALATLSCTFRWCVTGTPVGNTLDELAGQLRFLRIPQFCRWSFFKNNISEGYCENSRDSLDVLRHLLSRVVCRHTKSQTQDGRAIVTLPPRTVETVHIHFGTEVEKEIYKTIEQRNKERFEQLRSVSPYAPLSKFLELTALNFVARQACCHPSLVSLPRLNLTNESLERFKKRDGGPEPRKNECTQDKNDVLKEALDKARPSAKSRTRALILEFYEGSINLVECCLCMEMESDIACTPCGHFACRQCLLNVLDDVSSTREARGRCPTCRENFSRSELTFLKASDPSETQQEKAHEEPEKTASSSVETMNGFQLLSKEITSVSRSDAERVDAVKLTPEERRDQQSSFHTLSQGFLTKMEKGSRLVGSKINQLLLECRQMTKKDSRSKAVVFSQFRGVLDIAATELGARGFEIVRVDGTMKQHERADALAEFSNNPNIKVMLLSLRVGAVGLNLIAADHCFIMDVATNSALEEQCFDRIHRLGQTRPVTVKRFVIAESVEERIYAARRKMTNSDAACAPLDESWIAADQSHQDDRTNMQGSSFNRLRALETMFGCDPAKEY